MVVPRAAPVSARRRPQLAAWREEPPEDAPATVADGAVERAVLIQCLITAVG